MRNRFDLVEGGHFQKKGYHYILYLKLPEISKSITVNMQKREHVRRKVSFDTKIDLTRNPSYYNIEVAILGFGLGLEIQNNN
jgi:hypothetical protein|tara:strand:- start:317 stop:562 length:246 start_codon:yes stop_codon:yes gene_type:complete